MLPYGKLAVLLLVVCMVSPEHVTSKKPICTMVQIEKILEKCGFFIQSGHPTHLVSRDAECCAAVSDVQDMECIILFLTEKEKTKSYSVEKIPALRELCASDPSPKDTGSCSNEQKEAVLHDCEKFIKHGSERRKPIPVMGQTCCNAVNKVAKKGTKIDMQCIVDLLTNGEKQRHDASKIMNLPNHCEE